MSFDRRDRQPEAWKPARSDARAEAVPPRSAADAAIINGFRPSALRRFTFAACAGSLARRRFVTLNPDPG
jgi:hypothetical protein